MIAPPLSSQLELLDRPKQGTWTYEDYLQLPDDGQRYEIIEGVLYVNAAPSFDHQSIVDEISFALNVYVRQKKLGKILTAPIDVRLSALTHPVQPDVIFLSPEKIPAKGAKFVPEPPDLVVEVLSPSTYRYDQSVKLDAYEAAGVREYWIVDPKAEDVTVYTLPENEAVYVFQGQFTATEKIDSPLFPDLDLRAQTLFR